MEVISGEEFLQIIYSDDIETFSNVRVEIKNSLNINLENVNLRITFSNITFSGKQINFTNHRKEYLHQFKFEYCIFKSNIFIQSYFEDLSFKSNTFDCDKFYINSSNFKTFEFLDDINSSEKTIFNKGSLKVHDCEFESVFWFKDIQFSNNTTIDFSSVRFLGGYLFDSVILDQITFYDCNFYKDFRYDCLYKKSQFRECTFSEFTTFSGLPYLNSSFLWFENCVFKKLANFNNYRLHKFRLEETTFSDNVSFQQAHFDTLCFVRTIFEKKVWFDDIQIKKIDDCDRITIRTIKQELQKAENRIDYNKFRNYELAAHYRELKLCTNFKDTSILWATKWSSNFGSWTWAFWFTLIVGFVFFTFFFIAENINKTINLNNWPDFIYGYFRFFLITDFKNEYYESGESVLKFNSFISLFPFIIGKIAVAFGIYEMIQSFRKFKA